jgi:hypothetical protein
MLQMRSVYPTAQDVLNAAPREIAGVLLTLFNGEGTMRFHPKNLRNFLVEAYRGPQADHVLAHVLDAMGDSKAREVCIPRLQGRCGQ